MFCRIKTRFVCLTKFIVNSIETYFWINNKVFLAGKEHLFFSACRNGRLNREVPKSELLKLLLEYECRMLFVAAEQFDVKPNY